MQVNLSGKEGLPIALKSLEEIPIFKSEAICRPGFLKLLPQSLCVCVHVHACTGNLYVCLATLKAIKN